MRYQIGAHVWDFDSGWAERWLSAIAVPEHPQSDYRLTPTLAAGASKTH